MTTNGKPTLSGCDVLPPMATADEPPKETAGRQSGTSSKAAGRFAVFNAFVDATAGTLTRSEILVWLVLFRDCRDGTARTGQADIARRANLSRKTVIKAIRRLVRRGVLRVVHRGGFRRGPSRYRVFPVERNAAE